MKLPVLYVHSPAPFRLISAEIVYTLGERAFAVGSFRSSISIQPKGCHAGIK